MPFRLYTTARGQTDQEPVLDQLRKRKNGTGSDIS